MYVCVMCPHKGRQKFAVCPKCKALHTCAPDAAPRRPRLSDIEARTIERFDVGTDWNTALGGGAPLGSVILIASRGGSGKTTEMLRVAGRLGTKENPAYYFFSERTDQDLADQAALVSAERDHIVPIGPVTSLDEILELAPSGAHIFLDSWGNLLTKPAPEDLSKFRDLELLSAWAICHVNKRGDIEGREKLSHLATAVVWVGKTRLRTSKNWYGPQISVERDLPEAFRSKDPAKKKKRAAHLRAL